MSRASEAIEAERRFVVARGWEAGDGEDCWWVWGFHLGDENVLQLDRGDSCTTLRMPPGDFPGDAVVKNPPADAGDTGSIPRPGRSHMPWSN